MVKENLTNGLKLYDYGVREECDYCQKVKKNRKSFPISVQRKVTAVLDLVHSEVCNPVENMSVPGCRYCMTIIDYYSRFCFSTCCRRKKKSWRRYWSA